MTVKNNYILLRVLTNKKPKASKDEVSAIYARNRISATGP